MTRLSIRCLALALVSASVALAGCADIRIRKAAQTQLRNGDYEQAVGNLEQGLKSYPESARLRAGLTQAKTEALARLLSAAGEARATGKYDEAEGILRRARAFDASGARVDELLAELATERRQRSALAKAEELVGQGQGDAASKIVNEALKDNPRQPDLVALHRRLEIDQRVAAGRSAQRGLAEVRPISLDFRDAQLRAVLDVVSRHSGVNFVLDKDIRSDIRVTIYLKGAKVEDALDLLTSTHQLSKKVIDDRTILVYPNTPEKLREHQEQIVKVFYLVSSDAKSAAAFLKSMLRIREPYVDDRSNMLALRESPDNITLAERLIALYDSFEPEVLLELEVIEINSTRLTELGIQLPKSVSLTLLPPTGSSRLTLDNLRGISSDRVGVSVSDAVLNLRREVGDFNTLANPRIRVKSKEKAKVLIGDKVPVITSTTGQTGFVSDTVSYLDVGLKLDVEPTVFADDDVSIKVALEVSTLGSQIRTNSGTVAYQISTRNASTNLRLRDGETQLLAGLISTEDKSNASRVPGLGDLPVLGRLFSSQLDNANRTELVLSITPRVLRNVRRGDAAETELWVGTESQPRLRPVGRKTGVAVGEGAREGGVVSQAGGPMAGAAAPMPALPIGAAANAAPQAPVTTPAVLQWLPPTAAKVGDTFVLGVSVNAPAPLRGAPMQLQYDKARLEVVDVEEAEFFKQGGAPTSFSKAVSTTDGRVQAGVMRTSGSGATGSGAVVRLKLRALQAGPAEIALLSATAIGAAGPLPPMKLPAPIVVQVQTP